jgi:hypothetical protein
MDAESLMRIMLGVRLSLGMLVMADGHGISRHNTLMIQARDIPSAVLRVIFRKFGPVGVPLSRKVGTQNLPRQPIRHKVGNAQIRYSQRSEITMKS